MGFLMKRNDRGVVSSGMLQDLMRNWFPDWSDVLWKDLIPESRMHVKVEEECVKVQFAFPGCRQSDFEVEASGTFLTIKVACRRVAPTEEEGKYYSCKERSWGEYQESVKLPVTVIPAEAKAKYSDGVLEIILPRCAGDNVNTKYVHVQ